MHKDLGLSGWSGPTFRELVRGLEQSLPSMCKIHLQHCTHKQKSGLCVHVCVQLGNRIKRPDPPGLENQGGTADLGSVVGLFSQVYLV